MLLNLSPSPDLPLPLASLFHLNLPPLASSFPGFHVSWDACSRFCRYTARWRRRG